MRLAVKETETENLFETLANKSPVGLYIVQDGKFCYTNPTFQSNTGYREDELLGRNSLELAIPEDREMVRENAIKMLKGELTSPYQFRVTHKNGSIHWVIESVASVQYRGRRATLGNFVDITAHRQAEEALQAERNKLQSLVDAMEDTITIQDTEYNIIYQNEPSRIAFGGDHVGEKCYRAYEGRETMCDGCPVEKAFKDGKSHTAERRTVIGGKVTFWENTANPIRDAGDKIVSCLELARDITERKQMEEALRNSEEKLREMFESATDGILVIDLEGIITEANQRILEMHGFSSKNELLGKSAFELLAPRDHKRITANLKKAIKQGAISGVEYTLLRADGSEFPGELSTSALKDARGNLVGHITIVRDITERKQIEEALNLQRAYFQQLYDNSPDAINMVDTNDRVVQANKGFETLFGYPAEEIKGRLTNELIIPEDRAEEASALSRTLLDGEVIRTETVRRHKDGSLVDVSAVSYPIRFDDKLVGAYVIYSDITERKKAEEELSKTQAQLSSAVQMAHLGPWEYDAINDLFIFNDAFYELFHTTVEEVGGYTMSSAEYARRFVYPEDAHLVGEEVRKALQADDPNFSRQLDHRIIYADGEVGYISVRFFIVKDETGSTVRTYGVNQDITERKRAEEAIKHAAEEWRETFDSITDAISIHDRDFRVLRANKAFANIFHKKPSQIIGRHCYELHKGNKPKSGCPHKQTLVTKQPAAAEFYESNLGKYLHESTSPIFDDKGEVVATVHITRDVTEQKQQNERLMMADRLASIGELAAGTAHELNNPLTSVIGFSQLLIERDIPDDIREDLTFIYNEAQRAANVTKSLLTFGRKHAPVKHLNQINDIIEDVLKLRAYEHSVNSIEVKRQLAPDLPKIEVDYFQMQQVFLNIIINAEYFMTEAHNRGTLTITTKKNNSNVMISIADDGPGISRENLSRIFNPFFTSKEAGKGTGLGLSICHGIVSEHGGQIYARSQPGKGATIVVELPSNSR